MKKLQKITNGAAQPHDKASEGARAPLYCLECSTAFSHGRSDRKYCSQSCKNNYNQRKYYNKDNNRILKIEKEKQRKQQNREKYLLGLAKYRAKRDGTPFNIDITDVIIPTHCPLLGFELKKDIGLDDNTPTIDRISPAQGYTKGNVWVVSFKANRLKGDLTPEQLKTYCQVMLNKLK
jgi:hypothetical protein